MRVLRWAVVAVVATAGVAAVVCRRQRRQAAKLVQELYDCLWIPGRLGEPGGTTPMLERYDPEGFDLAAPPSMVLEDAEAPMPAAEVHELDPLLDWLGGGAEDLFLDRFEADWEETLPLPPPSEDEHFDVGRLDLTLDDRRHGRLRHAISCAARNCLDADDGAGASRLLLARLAVERQALIHDVVHGPGLTPWRAQATAVAFEATAVQLTRVGQRGKLPSSLFEEALRRLQACDELFPLAARAARMDLSIYPAVLDRFASPLVDASRLCATMATHRHPIASDGEPLRARQRTIERPPEGALPCPAAPHPWDYLLSPRRAVTDDLLRKLTTEDNLSQCAGSEVQAQAQLRTVAVLWAAALYGSRTGSWPSVLSDLTDLLPERMYRDPYTGEPLRMTFDGKRFLIWTPHTDGNLQDLEPRGDACVLAPI